MISFVVWCTINIIFTLTDFIIQFIYRTKYHDIIHAIAHIDWITFASLECQRVLLMLWETCICTNLIAMIIHLYYDIHHLKEGVGFGSALEKIVYSSIYRGWGLESISSPVLNVLCSRFGIEVACQNFCKTLCLQFGIANRMKQFPMRPATTGRAVSIMHYRFNQQKWLTLYIQQKLS